MNVMRIVLGVACLTMASVRPSLAGDAVAASQPSAPLVDSHGALIADAFQWYASDYVVGLFHNGSRVDPIHRHLDADVFGATGETATLNLREGDWLVFQLSSNPMRWGGARTFIGGATRAGSVRIATGATSDWTCCDDLELVDTFIAKRDDGVGQPVRPCQGNDLWKDGIDRWHRAHADGAAATPIWGSGSVTWIKLKMPDRLGTDQARRLDALPQWRAITGEWTSPPDGGIRGVGDSRAELRERLKLPCTVSFTLTVDEGMRPRVHLLGTNVYVGNEGYMPTLAVFGAKSQTSAPPPVAYALGKPVSVVARLEHDRYEIAVNNAVFAGTFAAPVDDVGLALSGGDGWSKGATRFEAITVAAGPSLDRPNATDRPADVPVKPVPTTRRGSIFDVD